MFEYSFSVKHEGCWTSDIHKKFPGLEATILQSHAFSDSSSTIIEVSEIDDRHADELVGWMQDHPVIQTVERLKYEDDVALIGLRTDFSDTETEPVGKVFREQPCIPLASAEVRNGFEHCQLMLPSREVIQTTYEELRQYGAVKIQSLNEVSDSYTTQDLAAVSRAVANLSPRQKQILSRAIQQGYYEVPQECNLEDLAKEDTVTMSTVAEHLRNAEHKIITAIAPLLEPDTN